MALWLLGFVMMMIFWYLQWWRISKAVRSAQPLLEGREVELLRKVEGTARLMRPVQMLSSTHSMEPGVFGILRPVLLWPDGISGHLDDAHLKSVLAHEVCHVQRRDNLTSVIHMLVEAIFWFHPLVWWMGGQLVKERERACDENVLLVCGQPGVYAESILKVCEYCVESPLTCVSGVTGADLKLRVKQIMTGGVMYRLTLAKKLLLLAMALTVVAIPIVLGQADPAKTTTASQGTDADAPMIVFDVASIRLNKSGSGAAGFGFGSGGDRFRAVNTTFLQLVGMAYGFNTFMSGADRIKGAPGWLRSEHYDIEAKVADSDVAKLHNLTPEQQMYLLKPLLANRLKLQAHLETMERSEYALVIAKSGPKLQEAVAGATYPDLPGGGAGGPGRVSFGRGDWILQGMTLSQLAHALSRESGRDVVDRTALKGKYDIHLKFSPEQGPSTAVPADEEPSIFAALEEQLGLRLEPTKGRVEYLVIDHVERPSPN
jgi:uncharacterized protein (TIGR03435 family)